MYLIILSIIITKNDILRSMLSWKEIVQECVIKHSDKVKKVTKPLRDHFGINYFTYHRIDCNGNYTVLLDRPDWAEHYVTKKFYLIDPYLRHPNVYKSGITYVDSFGSREYKEQLFRDGKKFFNAENMLLVIKKSDAAVSFFGYTSSVSLQKLYLNHLPLLASFQEHFISSLQPILRKMNDDIHAPLLHLKGQDFYAKQPIHPTLEDSRCRDFLQAIGHQIIPRLSKREKECMRLLLDGKSAKETASTLRLSRRTIEYYFENIKNKLLVGSKHELFQIAKELDQLNLL